MDLATDLRLGVRLPVAGPLASTDAIRSTAVSAEELGFEDVWLHDLIAWSRVADSIHISCGSREAIDQAGPDAPPQFFESLTTLAFLAGVTSRIGIGVSVLILPWREPIVTAKQVANIDVLSGGRLTLGIGVGGSKSSHNTEFELLGRDRRNKYTEMGIRLEAMKELWTQRKPQFDSESVSFDFVSEDTELNPKPIQKPYPPLWMGGAGPKSMAIAAQHADGWIPLWLGPEDYRDRVPRLRSLATEAGRDSERLAVGGTFPALVASSTEKAWAAAERTVDVITGGYSDALTMERVKQTSFIGSPADVAQRLQEYIDVGVSTYELRFIYDSIDHLLDQMRLVREEVVPRLTL